MNIIQIGTNRAYDYLASIVKQHTPDSITNLILVEPFSYHNDSILSCYFVYAKSLYIENIIITPNQHHNQTEKIWYHNLDSQHLNAYELASLNPQHATNIRNQYNIRDMKHLSIPCMTINELLDKYRLTYIDLLVIDTEGFDDVIIYSIDFNKYQINTILYEHLHIDKDKTRGFLQNLGYLIEPAISEDPYTDKATKY